MEGCYFFGKWKDCSDCEHWDGKDCRNGEKLVSEAEYLKDIK